MDTYSSITNPMDKEMANDIMLMEKHFTDSYNAFANETCTKSLKQDLITILENEHDMEYKLFEEINKRGWCTVDYASDDEIRRVRESYGKISE